MLPLLYVGVAAAQSVPLDEAEPFGVLGASAITSTGPTIVIGELGIHPNAAASVTGFNFSTPPGAGQVIGATHFADAVALGAQSAATTAYNTLAGRTCDQTISADLGGTMLVPGVYCSASELGLTGTLTLDAQGDPDAVFIFQAGSTLTTASNAVVNVINSGQACNVFWQVGSSATLGTGTRLVGSVLALASATLNTGASVEGRVIARTGAVTMDSGAVTVCSLALAQAPALSKSFGPSTIASGGVSTLTITLSNPDNTIATLTSALVDTLPADVFVAASANATSTCGGAGAVVAVSGSGSGSGSISLPAGRTVPAGGSCTVSVSVTSSVVGSHLNTLPAGALTTSNGSNPTPALATLVVPGGPDPAVSKSFAPATIDVNAASMLTIVLSNPNPAVATLLAPLTDNLPAGVVVAAPSGVVSNCGGVGAPTAVPGASSVTLPAGRSVPANGTCTLQVRVTSAVVGAHTNTMPAGALNTSAGVNPDPAIATITVVDIGPPDLVPQVPPSLIPSGSAFTAGALALLILFAGWFARRR